MTPVIPFTELQYQHVHAQGAPPTTKEESRDSPLTHLQCFRTGPRIWCEWTGWTQGAWSCAQECSGGQTL